MWSLVQYSLETQGFAKHTNNVDSRVVFNYKEKLFETLAEVLDMSTKPIDDVAEKTSLA